MDKDLQPMAFSAGGNEWFTGGNEWFVGGNEW
jgi:hypothetical protein